MSDFTAAIGHLGKASLKSVSYPDIFAEKAKLYSNFGFYS
jgi:hypothetical protein